MIPRRSLGALLLLALVATGCGAGRNTETDKERATPYVADATAGSVAVRAIRIVLASDATTTSATTPSPSAGSGAQAYLTATFVNRGAKTDTLINATVAGGAVQPSGFDVTGLPLPPSQVIRLVDPESETTGPNLIVGALSTQLLPGTTQKVTMTFQSAGTVTVDVPVQTLSDIGTTAPTAVISPGS